MLMSEGVKRVREAWKVSFGFPVILGMLRSRRQVGPLVVPLPFLTVLYPETGNLDLQKPTYLSDMYD